MSTKLAPALATLFLCLIEDSYIASSICKPVFYRRYIDDIFLVLEGSRMALDNFISGLNSIKPRLHFTAVISSSSVSIPVFFIWKFITKRPMRFLLFVGPLFIHLIPTELFRLAKLCAFSELVLFENLFYYTNLNS